VELLFPHLQAALGDPLTILFTALRVAVIYLLLLLFLHLSGKRILGQLTPFDLVTLLLISNAVQNAMIGPDNSLVGGITAAAVLLGLNRWVSQSSLRRILKGHPILLIHEGKVLEANLRRENVNLEELLTALREHGCSRPEEVSSAVLELDGTISVIPFKEAVVHRLRKVRSSRNR
jgi:uncharacterized membrane protein YcaP (DUF421 family)